MACVSAEENQTDVAVDDLEEGSGEILAVDNVEVGNFTELKTKIAESENELKLEKDYKYVGESDSALINGIEVEKSDYVLDGQGHTIDGSAVATLFVFHGSNVTLKNLKIINTRSESDLPAAVFFENGGVVDNCTFENNKGSMNGGAIGACQNEGTTLTVKNSKFINNKATVGGAIHVAESGEANISNSLFYGNFADGYGGAILCVSNITLDKCNFTDNRAYEGGALYFVNDAAVNALIFKNNSAELIGGALFFEKNGLVNNSLFADNHAVTAGAIEFSQNGTVDKCKFYNNYAEEVAGALDVVDNGKILNSLFVNNTSRLENAGAIYSVSNVIVDGCNFTNNSAYQTGGALFFEDNGLVTNSLFVDNCAVNGGAVEFSNNGTVDNCKFYNNQAEDYGGAVDVVGNGKILSSLFVNNTSRSLNAGAIYSANNVSVDWCNFTNNTAYQSGGAIQFYETGNVKNSIFINNSARHGGAIEFFACGEVMNSIFKNNAASEKGGAIYGYGITSLNSTFKNNRASNHGGAIYFEDPGSVLDSKFYDNNATNNGGAIWILTGDINNSTFENNIAKNGGAVYFKNNGTVNESQFTSNNASESAGAISLNGGMINNTDFIGNHAKIAGTVSTSGDLTVENTRFRDNSATDGGDNIVLIADAKLTLNNVTPQDLVPSHIAVIKVVNVENASYGGTVKITVNVTEEDGITPLSNGTVAVAINGKTYSASISNGTATIAISDVNAGSYDVNVALISEGYAASSREVKFEVSKINAKIAASAKSYVINYGGKYSITLRDANGKLLSGLKVTFTLNGNSIGSATTNSKGVATITLTTKVLKTAKAGKKNLVVKFGGNVNYNPISTTVKIKINKEKTKMVAKKKTFKKSKKTKKYAITLKNSKGKAIKNVKVTLKIKGKTFNAKTNSKGKATFKIKKLTKKGTFKAVVKFKGNKYYNKVTKTVKIKIK